MKTLLTLVAILPLLVACADTGNTASLSAYEGQKLVINYWAKWCKPCVKEIPELNELAVHRSDIAVLGVNYDGLVGDELNAQIEALGIEFPTLAADPSAELGVPRPVVLPTTFIVDQSGAVIDTLLGPQTLATLEAALEK